MSAVIDTVIEINGTLSGDCQSITWSDGNGWQRQQDIAKVHVVFMNHLDVGYAIHTQEGDMTGFIANVLNTYTSQYFPRAIAMANALRDMGYKERFVYTTHPWLVSLYVDCPENLELANGTQLRCPTEQELGDFHGRLLKGAGGVKRLLLSSANLSMAAWGYRRSGRFPNDENAIPTDDGALEVRSFELGVCVPPGDPDQAREDLPFVFPAAAAGQCLTPFIGIFSKDQGDRGVMHY